MDPSGGSLERWRAVRDQMRPQFRSFVQALGSGQEVPVSYGVAPAVQTP